MAILGTTTRAIHLTETKTVFMPNYLITFIDYQK